VKYLATAKWLAKDFVWLVLDARPLGSNPGGSTHAAVHAADAWLREYYGDETKARLPLDKKSKNKGARGDASAFARAGALQQAYVIEMPAGAAVDVVAVRPEGRNGALPNQDLLNTAVQLSRRAFPRAKVGLDLDPLDPIETRARVGGAGEAKVREGENKNVALIRRLSSFLERIGVFCLGKSRAFAVRQFVGDLRRASVFAWRCARGVPTGAHAAFKSFALDAATLRLGAPLGSARDKAHFGPTTTRETFRKIGSLLEMLARGSNNLIEQLHHSMFYYVMTSDDFFLSIAEYVAPQAAVSAAAAIVAIALATRGGDGDDGDHGDGDADAEKERDFGARKEHDWAPALALAAAAHAAGAGVGYASLCFYDAALSPIAVTGMTTASALAAHACLAWVASALYGGGGGLEAVSSRREPPWVTLKCVALATAATATAAVTFFNFPLAWPTTVALAPVCLSISQSRKTDSQRLTMKAKALAMALTPAFLALLVSLIEETSPFAFAYHLAETARSWRGGFAFPVAYAVVWPACALSALATCADALRGEGTAEREARTESKKSR
jgi:glycosylphosphatidylinositol transamidase